MNELSINISVFSDLAFVLVVAIKRPHEPIIFEKLVTFPMLIDFIKEYHSLDNHHFFLEYFLSFISSLFFINEIVCVSAVPSLQYQLVYFFLVPHPFTLTNHLHQYLTICQLIIGIYSFLGWFSSWSIYFAWSWAPCNRFLPIISSILILVSQLSIIWPWDLWSYGEQISLYLVGVHSLHRGGKI